MHASQPTPPLTIDALLPSLTTLLTMEQRPVNGLTALHASRDRRRLIESYWKRIQEALAPIKQAIERLPALPDQGAISWAQGVVALPNLASMEIDTTGLNAYDEVARFTLLDREGAVLEDVLIRPTKSTLSREAAHVNGLTNEQLTREGVSIQDAWERLQDALRGRYIVSYNQDWDTKQLAAMAQRFHLPPLACIGSDLQQYALAYFHRSYGLSLALACETTGHRLPEPPAQTALDRARGQLHLLHAMAEAITTLSVVPGESDVSSASLDDIDEHPF